MLCDIVFYSPDTFSFLPNSYAMICRKALRSTQAMGLHIQACCIASAPHPPILPSSSENDLDVLVAHPNMAPYKGTQHLQRSFNVHLSVSLSLGIAVPCCLRFYLRVVLEGPLPLPKMHQLPLRLNKSVIGL